MDLSINKINAIKKNNLQFKGISGAYDVKTTPVFKFYAPPHSKKQGEEEKVILELALLEFDDKTAQYYLYDKEDIVEFEFNDDDTLTIEQKEVRDLSSGFGYRYKIIGKDGEVRYELDPFKSIKISGEGKTSAERMNVIEQGAMYGISPKGGTMRHSFLDSDVRIDPATGKRAELNKKFVRNHFNKLGGSVAGLNWLLKNGEGELDPYRYFMTTPDIGVDKVSSHRYWPSNHYQCNNLETFKDFNFELFKRGKGYVADGAFTSQGIQSPLLQHVLKWGEESPFYNMLKIDGRISLGVLPDVSEADDVNPYEHIGVRLVNPKGSDYDKNKPTYIQFYDDRLLDETAQEDGQLHFDTNKAPVDHYEITTHQDSVQPYAFEIDPDDKKLNIFKKAGKNALLLSEIKEAAGGYQDFLTFPNFTIDTKTNVAGATCWDGNVDIIKMNLSSPTADKANREGFFNARNYLLGVATYWTESIQSHLILETAKASSEEKVKYALANEISPDKLEEIKNNLPKFNSLVLTQNKKAQDYVSQFPLQSLETSEELSAIFAQPQFQEEFLTEETKKELVDILNQTVVAAVPEKYKANDNYKAYVLKAYGNEILRHVLVGALSKDAISGGEIDLSKLKNVTLKSLEKRPSESPKDERKQVISHIINGIDINNVEALKEKIKADLEGGPNKEEITLETFKLAEAIVLQGKGGLNWRFDAAKDIGDLDAVKDGRKTFNQVWYGDERTPGVQAFWTDFIKRIKTYNPSAYVINEITSLGEFGDWKNYESMLKFDPQLAEAWKSLPDKEKGNYDKGVVYQQQGRYLNETNSTTTSEYSKGFNTFSIFAGVDPEHEMNVASNQYQGVKAKAGKLDAVEKAMQGLTANNQPHPVIYDHMFVSNHDKPSVLHTLPLNMSIYMASDLKDLNPIMQQQVKDITGRDDLSSINSKAAAVGIAMSKTIQESNYSDEDKVKLQKALQDLVNGKKTDKSKPNFKRAESFGVKPYEITIQDLFKRSGIDYNEEDVLKFHKDFLGSSMEYFQRMWQVMNACSGTPTIFAGGEFAQTGYETPSKNVYLGIRNEILHDLKTHPLYKEYFDKISSISSLYQNPQLSALRDGTPMYLDMFSTCDDVKNEAKKIIKELAEEAKINEGKLDYFAKEAINFILGDRNCYKQEDGTYAPKTLDELFDEIESGEEGFKHVYFDLFQLSDSDGNPEAFKKALEQVKKAIEVKLELADETSEEIQIWPVYRYNDRGSEVLSVITSLGLPQGVASWEADPAGLQYQHPFKEIPIKGKDGKCPFEENTRLKRYGDKSNSYIVKNGNIVNTRDGRNVVLKDTVTTFYKEKENLVKYMIQ